MGISRREFLGASAATVLLANGRKLIAEEGTRSKPRFRVLYGNDATNTVACVSPWHKKSEPFRPEMLEATVDEVAGTGVEVHLLQPGLGWIPWWKSTVYPADEHYRWFRERTGAEPDAFGKYMLDGGDMVSLFIDRCRQRGQSPFISLRMNDAHHLEDANLKSRAAIWASRFYVEHPEYRLGAGTGFSKEQRVLDWAIPEVRAHKFALIGELCANYDFDGLEMDFMRFYALFALDRTTAAQRRGIITGFVRQVRDVLDRTTRGRRRRWLCARVPCYLAAYDALGLDLPALVAAGLDMVNLSASYFTLQQTDLAAVRRLVPHAAVYLELCHTIWNGPKPPGVKGYDSFPFRRTTPEQYFTAAHLAYARGADGVSAFNFVYYREHGGPGRGPFCEPPFHVFRRLGDPAWLATQPQHYVLSSGWSNPFVKPSALPHVIAAKRGVSMRLDLAPPTGGWQHGGRVRIQAADSLAGTRWHIAFNGAPLSSTDDVSEPYPNPYPSMLGQPEQMRAWHVPAALLVDGLNHVELKLESGPESRVEFLDLAVS
jgi:hypothetical protein